jgi:hypothetical protein
MKEVLEDVNMELVGLGNSLRDGRSKIEDFRRKYGLVRTDLENCLKHERNAGRCQYGTGWTWKQFEK